MEYEERIIGLEIKVIELESLVNELLENAVRQQQMINERVEQSTETQSQLNNLMETVLLLAKRI